MPFLVIKSVLREAWTFVIKIILVFCLDVVQRYYCSAATNVRQAAIFSHLEMQVALVCKQPWNCLDSFQYF